MRSECCRSPQLEFTCDEKGIIHSRLSPQGFTLIEILVAISILAIALVIILQLFSGALKSRRVSDEYTTGVFYAQEKMEETLLSESLNAGVDEGEWDDGYSWRTEIVRMEQTEEESTELPFDTFEIAVEVAWCQDPAGKGKRCQLKTMKIVKKQEVDEVGELRTN